MKQKTKILLTSIASIAMCASVAVGGTFALFTAEEQVNIAVTSGYVDVNAYVQKESVVASTTDGGRGYVTPVLTDNGAALSLGNIMPKDVVSFTIKVENESSVDVQYRTVVACAEGLDLYSALEVRLGEDQKLFDGITAYSNWETLEEGEGYELPVTITLPEGASVDAEKLETLITYRVEAVQGNAGYVSEQFDENTLPVYTANDLRLLARSVNNGNDFAGKTIKLMEDVDFGGEAWTPIGTSENDFGGTFLGDGHTVSDFTVNGDEGVGFFGYMTNGTIDGLTVAGATIEGRHYVGGIVGYFYGRVTNCAVTHSSVTASLFYDEEANLYERGDKVGGIVGYMGEAYESYAFTGNSVSFVNVAGYRDVGGVSGTLTETSVEWVYQNNTINNAKIAFVVADGYVKDNDLNGNIGAIVGRYNGAVEVDDTNVVGENVDVDIDPTPDENGVLYIPAGRTAVVSGNVAPFTVSGAGTLVMQYATVDASAVATFSTEAATAAHALTLADTFTGNVEINAPVTLKGGVGGNGIYVPAGVTLKLSGDGELTAIGNAGYEYFTDRNNIVYEIYCNTQDASFNEKGGSGIGGEGDVLIGGITLTAEGYGVGAYGIGGANVTINGATILNARGGFANPNMYVDTSYGKSEPESAPAIGATNGGTVTLTGATVKEAHGGSKAAGIGAAYHNSVTINITNSIIEYVVGGNASAGIGGSRVPQNKNGENVKYVINVNIENSTITAQGGQFGAGIGSGYNTYCDYSDNKIVTIKISGEDSVINATGGKYGAGIGTGYHFAGLAGKIEVPVNATAGESREKYTKAQDVGFGVVDPKKEADSNINNSSIEYCGTVITIPPEYKTVNVTAETLSSITWASYTTYKFSGEFSDGDVVISVSMGLNEVVFDGTDATFSGQLKVWYEGEVLHGYESLAEEKVGSYTFNKITAKTLSVGLHSTTVTVQYCVLESLDYSGGRVNLNIQNNTIDSKSASHNTTDKEGTTEYSVYIYACEYTLSFTGNTVKGSLSHAVGINGRTADVASNTQGTNSIKAFSGNTFGVWGTAIPAEGNRAALKIWSDTTYKADKIGEIGAIVKEDFDETDCTVAGETNRVYCNIDGTCF